MQVIEGRSASVSAGREVAWRAEYEVVDRTIHFHAWFDGGATAHEGQFDFDASKLDAEQAVRAHLADHVARRL